MKVLTILLAVAINSVFFYANNGEAQTWSGQVSLWAETSVLKVTPATKEKTSTQVWNNNEVHLRLAQNEWESFQLILKAKGASQSYTPEPGAFKGPGGKTISPDQFRLHHAEFIKASRSEPLGIAGEYPDPLVPVSRDVKVASSKNTVFWITLKTNSSDAAGDYEGTIDFKSKGKTKFQVPVKITIWPFALSDEPSLKGYYHIDTVEEIFTQHNFGGKTLTKKKELVKKYANFLFDYRMYPGTLAFEGFDFGDVPAMQIKGSEIIYDFKESDKWLSYILNEKKLGIFRLPFTMDVIADKARYKSTKFKALTKSALKQLYQHYAVKDWEDKHFLWIEGKEDYSPHWISDEPYNDGKDGFDEMRFWGSLIKSAHSGLNYTVAAPPSIRSGWGSYVNVGIHNFYVDDIDNYPEKVAELIQGGSKVYVVPNSYSDNIDFPALYHRGLGFFAYKHGASGIEQWDVFGWYEEGGVTPNPWKGVFANKWGFGAGAMIYPGKGRKIEGPVSSVRLDLNRDAMEDHNYLATLEKYSGKAYARQVAQRLVPGYLKEMKQDPELYHSLRLFIVEEIIRLKNKGNLYSKKEGIVKDSTGKALEGVEVVSDFFGTTTGSNGRYTIYYKSDDAVTASLIGYKSGTGKAGSTISLTAVDSNTLVSFEGSDEPYEIGSGKGAVVTQYATRGSKAMKWSVAQNGEGEIGVDVPDSLKNWNSFSYLAWDVYNAGSTQVDLEVVLADAKDNERSVDINIFEYGQRLSAPPKKSVTMRVPLASLGTSGNMGFSKRSGIDKSQVAWFGITMDNSGGTGPDVLYIDNIRLE